MPAMLPRMMALFAANPFVFYAIVLALSVLSASTGIGTGFILIPLATLYFGPKEAVGICTLFFLFQSANKMLLFREHVRWKTGAQLLFFAIPGAIIGSLALSVLPADLFRTLFAAIILLYLFNEIIRIVPKIHVRERTAVSLFGLLYGFLSGLVGSGSVIKGPLLAGIGMKKEVYIGTYAFTSFFVNIPKLATYATTGVIDRRVLVYAIPFLLLSIAGTTIGRLLVRRMRSDVFTWILYGSFAVSAIVLLLE